MEMEEKELQRRMQIMLYKEQLRLAVMHYKRRHLLYSTGWIRWYNLITARKLQAEQAQAKRELHLKQVGFEGIKALYEARIRQRLIFEIRQHREIRLFRTHWSSKPVFHQWATLVFVLKCSRKVWS